MMGEFVNQVKAGWQKISPVVYKIKRILGSVFSWIYRLRKIIMAAPVVIAALKLAGDNAQRLPEMVGLNLQSTGDFAIMVTRHYAVYGPLGVTLFCLLLMFCSRKTVFPWIVSIFSLTLPWLIYLTNLYVV